MKHEELLTVKEVADILKLNILTVYDYIKRGEFRAIKLGRNYRVDRKEFDKFIQSHTS